MSLMEVMIVITIITFITTLAISRFQPQSSPIKDLTRNLKLLSLELYHSAKIKNKTYRLVIDMGSTDTPLSERKNMYWVESSDKKNAALLDTTDDNEEPGQDEESEEKKDPTFSRDEEILKEPVVLPDELRISDVEVLGKEKTDIGKVYIYYFPHGWVQESMIHLKYNESEWTIGIRAIGGKTEVIGEYISLRDLVRN